MKVRIRIRLTPLRRSGGGPKARLERVLPFPTPVTARRVASPLSVWAVSMMLTICFLSVSMFATLSPVPERIDQKKAAAVMNEEDPSQPIVGQVTADCRVMLVQRARASCLDAMEYRADTSAVVVLGDTGSTGSE